MIRRTLLLAALAIAAACVAQDEPTTILRHEGFVAFHAEAGDDVRLAVESFQRGPQYGTLMAVTIIDSQSNAVLRQTVPLNEAAVVRYVAQTSGLHVARVQMGWNTGTIEVLDRPWALVAWTRVPVNICGSMRPQYFFVPEHLEKISLTLSASVTNEGALVQIHDPDGNLVYEEEGDFDAETRIDIEAPPATRGKAWSLTVAPPADAGLNLDDVKLYLGQGLPAYLAEKAEWLEEFVTGDQYQPDMIDRVVEVPGGASIPRGESITLTWEMTELPQGQVYALRLSANDVDYVNEVPVSINGGETFYVPMTGNATTETFTIHIAADQLVIGENTLVFTQNPAGGSNAVWVRDVQVLIGERIREFRGW